MPCQGLRHAYLDLTRTSAGAHCTGAVLVGCPFCSHRMARYAGTLQNVETMSLAIYVGVGHVDIEICSS